MRRSPGWFIPALVALAYVTACGGDAGPDADVAADSLAPDTLTSQEQSAFAVDPLRYTEMQDGRLDTVDMISRADDAAWHAQAMNYTPNFIAMTYAAWHSGPDSVANFAADGQPRLEDNLGNVYRGLTVPNNPRIKVEAGTTAVGVYVFNPQLAAGADSLTLFLNDSTAPVIRVGPFGVEHSSSEGVQPSVSESGN
ncbi:MAG: hypothetical protein ABR559_05430 [Gemmatimonadota bacterium]